MTEKLETYTGLVSSCTEFELFALSLSLFFIRPTSHGGGGGGHDDASLTNGQSTAGDAFTNGADDLASMNDLNLLAGSADLMPPVKDSVSRFDDFSSIFNFTSH